MTSVLERPPTFIAEGGEIEPGGLTIVLGVQSGDEGKGKIAALLAKHFQTVASGQGGPNAGHTQYVEGIGEVDTHTLTSAVVHLGKLCLLGNGKLIHPVKLRNEKQKLEAKGLPVTPANVAISGLTHFIKPGDVFRDAAREKGKQAQGSTKSGIAFSASDKSLRSGIRLKEVLKDDPKHLYNVAYKSLRTAVKNRNWRDRIRYHVSRRQMRAQAHEWVNAAQELGPFIVDSVTLINEKLNQGEDILVEGAQGFWLDPDHGKWPDVTSMPTTTAGILQGLGVAPQRVKQVIGVAKLTKSQVGGRPFITQIYDDKIADAICGKRGEPGSEYGTTTGRRRMVGYFDVVELRNAVRVNGVTELAITKMDCANRFGDTMKVAVTYTHKITGEKIKWAPNSVEEMAEYEPDYIELPTWGEISHVRHYDDLPQAAKDFAELVKKEVGVPITIFGVGVKDEEVIVRSAEELANASV